MKSIKNFLNEVKSNIDRLSDYNWKLEEFGITGLVKQNIINVSHEYIKKNN
jgi:hypothetical protein